MKRLSMECQILLMTLTNVLYFLPANTVNEAGGTEETNTSHENRTYVDTELGKYPKYLYIL